MRRTTIARRRKAWYEVRLVKSRFSRRYGFDPKRPKEGILEDAPTHTRSAFIQAILRPLLYVDQDKRYRNPDDRPLGIKSMYEAFQILRRAEISEAIWDSWHCGDVFDEEVMRAEWYHFYDLVELTGAKLIRLQPDNPFEDLPEEYGFDTYRNRVNDLFEEDRILWRLDENSNLLRLRPTSLERRMRETDEKLSDAFEPARSHYKKAVRYLHEHPLDPENAVKEMVSCVESAARILYPGSKTLGDAVKKMRAERVLPPGLLSTVEKYYGFASAEPAVRHGGPRASRIGLNEAELSVHIGIALVRYLVSRERETRG